MYGVVSQEICPVIASSSDFDVDFLVVVVVMDMDAQ